MFTPKSPYDEMMEQLHAEGRIHTFSEEENIQVQKELSEGMEDFLMEQKFNEKKSELELAGIILNAWSPFFK